MTPVNSSEYLSGAKLRGWTERRVHKKISWLMITVPLNDCPKVRINPRFRDTPNYKIGQNPFPTCNGKFKLFYLIGKCYTLRQLHIAMEHNPCKWMIYLLKRMIFNSTALIHQSVIKKCISIISNYIIILLFSACKTTCPGAYHNIIYIIYVYLHVYTPIYWIASTIPSTTPFSQSP